MQEIKNTLNTQQKKAVTHGEGPLLIVAGAGTGKTTVITQRIAHLILDKDIGTDEILALTFTEKAAEEMSDRVDKLLPMGYVDLWISTFHSFCEKILKLHGLDIGLPNDFKLLNDTAQWLLVRQNFEKFNLEYYKPLGNPTKFIHALLGHFSRCKDEEIYPDDYQKYANKLKKKLTKNPKDELLEEEYLRITEIAKAYKTYQDLLLEENALDFGDLINYTLTLFKKRKNICKKYQEQFKHILVDEFQDTNFAQYNLVRLLASDDGNLTVVGDDDQSIYKFRGASVSNILQFKKDFKSVAEVVLTDNYRSCQEILDLSYNFVQLNNPNRLEAQKGSKLNKKLKSHKNCTGTIQHLHFATSDDEVTGVIQKIVDIKAEDPNLSWGDFAILVRANQSAKEFITLLRKTDIPYHYVALKGLYTKPLILDILSYFKILENFHDSKALFRVLRSPVVEISDDEIVRLTHFANKKNKPLYDVLGEVDSISEISPESKKQLRDLHELIHTHQNMSRSKTAGEMLLRFLKEDTSYLEDILNLPEQQARTQANYLNQFYQRIKAFEEAHDDPTVHQFMEEIELEVESGESGSLQIDPEIGPDVIKIMTIHSSKGLEFEHVFIPNMVHQRFPTINRKDPIEIPEPLIKDIIPKGDHHIEEERRLLYVGMTRAKTGLYLTSAEDYGGARKKKLSQFLYELENTNDFFKITDPKKTDTIHTPKIEEKSEPNYLPMSTPKHFSFSQIAAFKNCPYQYKLAFLYKIPTLGKGQFSYGKTMHSTLQQLYTVANERAEQHIGQASIFDAPKSGSSNIPNLGALVSLDEVLEFYEQNWIDDWYDTKEQRDEYYEKGKATLGEYYTLHKDTILRTKYLEKGFMLKVAKDPKNPNEMLSIKGFIDRIDILEDGTAEIIDYKTGKPKEKLVGDEKTQLLLYQLAAQEIPELTEGHPVSKLTFYYLDNNSTVSFIGKDADIEKLSENIHAVTEQILESNFTATPDPIKCTFCDFRNICEYRAS